jgi:2-octaprenyl-6-methoxyphenol hydroxylase
MISRRWWEEAELRMDYDHDIAIIGGGLVGASLACALANTGLRIAVIEAVSRQSESQPSYDDRVLAIAPGSRNILHGIGIWQEIAPGAVVPIKTIHVSDRGRFGFARLHHAKHGTDAMGYAVPARELGAAMDRKMGQLEDVTMVCPAEVTDLTQEQDRVRLELHPHAEPGETSAALVVFADGADSAMRRSLNFKTTRRDYGQCVILTTVTPDRGHDNVAYERFTDSGPMALLPSINNRYTVIWTIRSDQVEELLQCSDEEFLERLQYRFGDRAGALRRLGKRKTYPLSFVSVKHPVRHRIVVAGNAAHTIHPVAGQGFNLGLRDVATLSEVLSDAQFEGRDIGDIEVLERYWQWRRRDINRMSGFTDGLIRLFSNNSTTAAMVRDTALLAIDMIPPAQNFLVRRTMGLAGRLPRLTRGLPLRKADAPH